MGEGLLYRYEYLELLRSSLNRKLEQADEKYLAEQKKLADQLLVHRVAFTNDWDMEKCTEYFDIPTDWSTTPNKDGEWIYSLNRMEFLPALWMAYWQTRDMEYVRCWQALIRERGCAVCNRKSGNSRLKDLIVRIRRKTIGQKKFETDRTLDTAIRICILAYGLLCAAAWNVELPERECILKEIHSGVAYLTHGFRQFDKTSNWGAIILAAQIIATCITAEGRKEAEESLRHYTLTLNEVLDNQLSDSGVQSESSPMYHTQVAIYVVKAIYYLSRLKIDVPTELYEKARRMARFILYLAPESNIQIPFGDSDETDVSSVLWLCDTVLWGKVNPEGASGLDLNLCADICPEACVSPEGNIPALTEPGFYGDAGYFKIQRGKWCVWGFQSRHKSGHSHGDMGSIALSYEGIPFLIDSGRYTYRNCEIRRQLKSPEAHNVVLLNDGDDWAFPDAWVCYRRPSGQMWGGTQNSALLAMGYQSNVKGHPVHVVRFLAVTDRVVLICDHVISDTAITAGQNYIVSSRWKRTSEQEPETVFFVSDIGKLCISSPVDWNVCSCKVSPAYNILTDGERCFSKTHLDGGTTLASAIGTFPCKVELQHHTDGFQVCACDLQGNEQAVLHVSMIDNEVAAVLNSNTLRFKMEGLFDES